MQKALSKRLSRIYIRSPNGYSVYRRRDNGHYIEIRNGIQLANRWIVPYNIKLVEKYNAHINIEICNSLLAIKYLYKYIYKGHDRATVTFSQHINRANNQIISTNETFDKIKMYLDARYVSSSESIWRIFHYKMHRCTPKVQRLAVHLPNHQMITFSEEADLHHILNTG